MKRILGISALALGLAAAGAASASDAGRRYDDHARYDWARVVSVETLLERTRQPVASQVCREEPVEYYEPGYSVRRDRGGATLAGALIGGALGNLAGKGDGRKATTLVGALIGGSIANDNARRHGDYYQDGRYVTAYEERCDRRTSWRNSEEVVGYEVTYRYDGRNYNARLDHDPGSRLRVRVGRDVTPAE